MTDDLWNEAAARPAPGLPSPGMPEKRAASAARPVAKVAASGQAGALALVLVYVAGLLGLELPVEVAASLVGLIMFAAGYLKRG